MTALLLLTVLSFTTARAQDEGSGESEDTHEQQETTPEDEAPPRTPEPAHAAEEPVSEESDPADLAPENPAEESEQDDGTDEEPASKEESEAEANESEVPVETEAGAEKTTFEWKQGDGFKSFLSEFLEVTKGDYAKEKYPVIPSASVQLWGTAFDMDQDPQADGSGYGDPEDDVGFKVRRARIGIAGILDDVPIEGFTKDDVRPSYSVELGYSAPFDGLSTRPELELLEASISSVPDQFLLSPKDKTGRSHDFRFSWIAGLQRVPFGREAQMSSKELVFQERSIMSNHITPQRDVGATFRFQYNEWRMSLGAFNGNGNPLGDDNPGILLVGRAEYNNSETPLETTYGVVEEPILQAGVGAFYNRDTATSEVGAGGDLLFRWDGLAVLLDAQWIRIDPTSTTIDTPGVLDRTHRLGAVLQVGYSIRGRLEPAARLEYFDDNLSLRDNGDLILGMLGVTSHLRNDTLRLGAGYVLRYELAGTSVPNDTLRAWVQASW